MVEDERMMHSTRLTAAMIALVLLTAPALALLAYRNVETSILLAGLAAILGVVVAAVLMADALTRPLVEMADAVATLARARTAELDPAGSNKHRMNVITLEPCAQRKRPFGAESASYSVVRQPLDGAVASGNQAAERRCKHTSAPAMGSTIDIIIPSDRREQAT
jgi:hypothetical protein